MQSKKCPHCKKEKPSSDFHTLKDRKIGWLCKPCYKKYDKERQKKYRKVNRKKKIEQSRKRYKADPEKFRGYGLKKNFNMSLEDYNKLWTSQNGLCAVCDQPETAVWRGIIKHLAVDHDHKTGKIRGLLCMKCNQALGHANDDVEILLNMVEYLQR